MAGRQSAFESRDEDDDAAPALSATVLDRELAGADFDLGLIARGSVGGRSEPDEGEGRAADGSEDEPQAALDASSPARPAEAEPEPAARVAAPVVLEVASVPVAIGDMITTLTLGIRGRERIALETSGPDPAKGFLHVLAGLARSRLGHVRVFGERFDEMKEEERAAARARTVGFVVEDVPLVASLSILENLLLPLTVLGRVGAEARARAAEALEWFEISSAGARYVDRLPDDVVARARLARAIVHRPPLLIVDAHALGDGDVRGPALDRLGALVDTTRTTVLVGVPPGKGPSWCGRTVDLAGGGGGAT